MWTIFILISENEAYRLDVWCCFDRLDEALSHYLGEMTEITPSEEFQMEISEPVRKCPQCGRDMVLKPKKDGG